MHVSKFEKFYNHRLGRLYAHERVCEAFYLLFVVFISA
jgi:hypothetical protein